MGQAARLAAGVWASRRREEAVGTGVERRRVGYKPRCTRTEVGGAVIQRGITLYGILRGYDILQANLPTQVATACGTGGAPPPAVP